MAKNTGRGFRLGHSKARITRNRPGKEPERFFTPPADGSPFAALAPRRPIFGELPSKRRSKTKKLPLSVDLMAVLKRERPEIADVAELERRFHPVRLWRFDVAWTSHRVAVECDGGIYSGGAHVRGGHVESDAEKVSEAACYGWRVLRVTRKMIDDGRAVDLIVRALAWKEDDRGNEGD